MRNGRDGRGGGWEAGTGRDATSNGSIDETASAATPLALVGGSGWSKGETYARPSHGLGFALRTGRGAGRSDGGKAGTFTGSGYTGKSTESLAHPGLWRFQYLGIAYLKWE